MDCLREREPTRLVIDQWFAMLKHIEVPTDGIPRSAMAVSFAMSLSQTSYQIDAVHKGGIGDVHRDLGPEDTRTASALHR